MAILIREEQMLDELHKLAPERWNEVLEFIRYLRYKSQRKTESTVSNKMTASDLLNSEIVGMWADRTDISDSYTFARELRKTAETQRMQRYTENITVLFVR